MTIQTAIPRTNLHDTLVSEIREMIERGDLKPGDKVSEQKLCQRFDVSRTPLREALKVLAFEGLLQLKPRRGVYVSSVSAADVAELFPIMGALEGLAGSLVCTEGTDKDIAELRAIHDRMEKYYDARDEQRYRVQNRAFHETLIRLSRNPTLQQMYAQMVARIRFSRFVIGKTDAQWQAALQDHRALIVALEARDASRATDILYRHIVGVAAEIARTKIVAENEA